MLLAADNIHGLNPIVAQAMCSLDAKPVRELARQCEGAGARLIDINPGHLSPRTEDRMTFLVETVQDTVDVPLMLDSPNLRVLEKGLAACATTPVINAVWLNDERFETVLPLAIQYNARIVALLMDEQSFPPATLDEKLALAIELRARIMAAGVQSDRIIFDPVLPNLSWPDAFERIAEAVKTVRLLSGGAVFQEPVATMAGLSNLRSGLRRTYPLHVEETCLAVLAGAGLGIALADVLQPGFGAAYRSVTALI